MSKLLTHEQILCAYHNDPTIHAFIDAMVGTIVALQLTPAEMRACAMFAACRAEEISARSLDQFIADGGAVPRSEDPPPPPPPPPAHIP